MEYSETSAARMLESGYTEAERVQQAMDTVVNLMLSPEMAQIRKEWETVIENKSSADIIQLMAEELMSIGTAIGGPEAAEKGQALGLMIAVTSRAVGATPYEEFVAFGSRVFGLVATLREYVAQSRGSEREG